MKPIYGALLICAALGLALWPELTGTPDLNDNVLHLTLINGMADALQHGENPFDFWSPEIGLGEPIARLYQPMSHFVVVIFYFLMLKMIPLGTVFLAVKFLALALLPLSFYACARLLSLPGSVAFAAALLAPLVSGDSFGVELGAFVWAGHGLFPQLVATHGLLLAIGAGYRYIIVAADYRGLERFFPPWLSVGLLVGFTGWCNLLYGYVAGVSLLLVTFVSFSCSTFPQRFRCFLKVAAVSSFCALPKIWVWYADRSVLLAGESGSRQWMADSWGSSKVLGNLFTGEIFDHGRLPVISALLGVAFLLFLFVHWLNGKFERIRFSLSAEGFLFLGFGAWLGLYFGRPFWGDALYVFGISPAMPLHRLIGPLQVFGVLLAAMATGALWLLPLPRKFLVLLTVVILAPAFQQQMEYLRQNRVWSGQTRQAFDVERDDLQWALNYAKVSVRNGGRVFAGQPLGYGEKFKVGAVPLYSLLPVNGIPSVGFLYIGFLRANGLIYDFDWTRPGDYPKFDVRIVLAPSGSQLPGFLHHEADFGRFGVWSAPGVVWNSPSLETHADGKTATLKVPYHPGWKSCAAVCSDTWPDANGFTVGRIGEFRYRP